MSRSPSPQPWDIGPPREPARESRKLGTFFSDKTFSDVTIKFGDLEIFAHRESKQTSIDIGDDDDPAAVTAMLRFFYDAIYCVDGLDGKSTDQHLIMYRLADLYDAPELRREASRRLIERFSTSLRGWYVSDQDQPVTVNHIVRSISQILGPSADTFADNDIQGLVFNFVIQNASSLYKNELFQELLGDGTLFDEAFGRRFAQKTSELITRLESRIPKPNSWGTPVADPSSWDSTGPTAW
ncbi:hypothetical protein KCU71_g6910, partial [Aureobasidium melanogenum]